MFPQLFNNKLTKIELPTIVACQKSHIIQQIAKDL
ncbi:hypothetical protein HD_1408 [[Haemophilus] ducreyi 35000HP]|uniref:Uncharacterized protein n=1 Tax=Haemophilus ducreyi (strain 35000HP / ATCC 700724) TaxID=233412 RepID=Q7VLM0_HAEDU|nr:hypothetical protein HD_1408 [[Haemophilus] ducreyi 35000HP]